MALEPLGIGPDSEAIYVAILRNERDRVRELVLRLGGPAVEAALAELEQAGLIAPGAASVAEAAAVNPVLALEAAIDRRGAELLEQHRAVVACRAQISAFYEHFDRSREPSLADNGVDQVIGIEAIRESLAELAFFARESVMSVQPGGAQSPEAIEASRPLDHRALRRGLSLRVIHEREVLDDELNRGYLRELTELGVGARIASQDLDRMVIFDSSVAVVALDPRDSRRGALIVRQPGLVSGFVGLFERLWHSAQELPWSEVEDSPTPTDSDILRLLAQGYTDEAIAREMAISVRHLRRHIANLMRRLDAGSRFEAGVEALRRGWL